MNLKMRKSNYHSAFDMVNEINKEPKRNIEEYLSKLLNDIEHGRAYIKRYGTAMNPKALLYGQMSAVYILCKSLSAESYPCEIEKKSMLDI